MSAPASRIAQLARTVADPGDARVVWLRRAGGRKVAAGHSDLDAIEAIASGPEPERLVRRMFAVRVAPDVVVLDVDDPGLADTAQRWAEACRASGVEVVEVRSGRDGHLHLWCRPRDESTHTALVDTAQSLGLEVRTGNYMRPPGSHNDFGDVEVVGGLDRALEVLAPPASPPSWARRRATAPVQLPSRPVVRAVMPQLSRATVAVLRQGDGNPDRSRTLQRVVCGMVAAGWSLDAAWDQLRRGSFRGVEKLNDKLHRYGEETAYRYLAHCWRNAAQWLAQRPGSLVDPTVRTSLEAMQLEADSVGWAGESGANAWMVLHQLLSIAYRGGCEVGPGGQVTLTASERQLAEAASVSRETVHAALGALQAQGWVTRLESGAGPKGSTWRLEPDRRRARTVVPLSQPPKPTRPTGGVVANGRNLRVLGGPLPVGHDAFRRRAAGVNGYRVLRALVLWGEAGTAHLAARLGINQGSVLRVLKKLGSCGLVQRLDRRWAVVPDVLFDEPHAPAETAVASRAALDGAAERLGTAGAAQRQRWFHALERQAYRATASYALAAARAWSPPAEAAA